MRPRTETCSARFSRVWPRSGRRAAFGTCFAAGTPLLTPEGSKRIEDFEVSDLLLSRSENDPEGPVEAKRVLTVFRRLRARGRACRRSGGSHDC